MRILFFFFLLMSNKAIANPDSLEAVRLFQQVSVNIEKGTNENIDSFVQRAYTLFFRQDDLYNCLLWYRKTGRKWRDVKRYDHALYYFETALNKMWREARNKEELSQVASLNRNIGWLYYKNLNAFESAVDYYEKYKILYIDSLKASEINVAKHVYSRLGNIYSGLRDEAKSIYYLEQVKYISKKESKWDLHSQACRNIAGLFKSLGKYSQAIKAIQDGLSWKDSTSIEERILLYNEMSLCHYHLDDYPQARHYTKQAQTIFDKNKNQFSKNEIAEYQYGFYFNYGRINKGEKKFAKAEQFYHQAQRILEVDLQNSNSRTFAIMQSNFAHLYLEQGQLKKAAKHFQAVIPFLSTTLAKYDDPFSVPIKDVIQEDLLAYVYQKLGNIAVAEYQKNQKSALLHRGIRYYELADLVNQLQLQNYTAEESNLTALGTQRELKEDIQFALYELSLLESADSIKEKMFAFSEKSRSFLLLEQNRLAEDIANWDEAAKKNFHIKKVQQQSLKEAIYNLSKSASSNGKEEMSKLQKQLLETEEDLAVLKNKKNKAAKFKLNQPSSANVIQQILAADQALIEFFVGENHIYTYVLSKQDFNIYRIPRTTAFYATVENLRNSLIDYKEEVAFFGDNAFALYDYLLKKPLDELPKNISRLVFAKDQFLNFIPFEVLINQPFSEGQYYHNLPYLVHPYSITYANSATLFEQQKKIPQARAQNLFAAYAPSYQSQNIAVQDTIEKKKLALLVRSGNYDLKGAQAEVQKISTQLNGDSFLATAASESHFKKHAANYRILLLSMHGMVNEAAPNFSQLLFTPHADPEMKDDNLLHPIELYNLKLNADLVVLSACETGIGKIYPGEGVFSFSRAFAAAGVPSTVMSLWQVDDHSTAEIMVSFFEHLRKGLSKDKALQEAQLNYLSSHKNNHSALHPYFWAGLQICGNSDALDWPRSYLRGFGFLLLTLLFVFFLIYFLKK